MSDKFQTASDYLLESLLLSDKNYGIDLDRFPKKVKVLFIVGLSGSGKTTLSDKIKNNIPDCEIIHLDDVWNKEMETNITKGGKADENIVKKNLRIVGDYLKTALSKNRSKCKIVEGVYPFYLYQLYGKSFISFMENYPIILLGTSVVRSSINQLKRDKFKFRMKYAWYTLFDDSEYNNFKKDLLSNKKRKIEEIKL